MKRPTKVSLRTKIYLAIAGLLSLGAGALYGVQAFPFASLEQNTGIAISPNNLYATQFCGQGLFRFDCAGGMPTLVGLIPLGPQPCIEKYMSIAPLQSLMAGNPPGSAPFTPTDVFISEGSVVYKFTAPAGPITFFNQIPPGGSCVFSDHSSLKFDKVGTFGFNLTMTCEGGDVYTMDGNPAHPPTFVGTFAGHGHDPVHIEGQEVAPASFGPLPNQLGGKLLVADENTKSVDAMDNLGNVTFNVFNWSGDFGKGAENVRNIPANLGTCSFGCIPNQPVGSFFQMCEDHGFSAYYPPTDFTTGGLNDGRHVLVTTEADPPDTVTGTILVAFDGTNYVSTVFDTAFNFTINEGAQFVECDAVTPTPTPTATATATFTPTPTATATFTPTPTPTPTVTPTPTATPSGVCPLTIGYWKNHPNAWPVNSLMLGTQTYTKAELLAILNNPGGGDASMIMAVQLIAAKLNIAAGSDPTPIASTITHADSLLAMFSGKLPYHVAPSSTIGQMMVSDGKTLDNYNNGRLTPNCGRDRPDGPARRL